MVTIPDLLIAQGYWKPKPPARRKKKNPPGLCVHSDGRASSTKVTLNGKTIPGIYRLEFIQTVHDYGNLVLWAHASVINIQDFKGNTEIQLICTGEAWKEAIGEKA